MDYMAAAFSQVLHYVASGCDYQEAPKAYIDLRCQKNESGYLHKTTDFHTSSQKIKKRIRSLKKTKQ